MQTVPQFWRDDKHPHAEPSLQLNTFPPLFLSMRPLNTSEAFSSRPSGVSGIFSCSPTPPSSLTSTHLGCTGHRAPCCTELHCKGDRAGSRTSFCMQRHQSLERIPQVPPTPTLPATSPGLPSLVSRHGHFTGGRSVAAHGLHLLPSRVHATWRTQETGAIPARKEGGQHCQPRV